MYVKQILNHSHNKISKSLKLVVSINGGHDHDKLLKEYIEKKTNQLPI